MSHIQADGGRKPLRLGVVTPLAVLILAAVLWSGVWLSLSAAVQRRLREAQEDAAKKGGELTWTTSKINGFPFRLDVDLSGVQWRDASGHALFAARVQAEAFVFSPGRWVAVAPAGVTYTRPLGGPVVVTAKALRASVAEATARPPRVSVEAIDVAFATPAGAEPFALSAVAQLHLHSKSGPRDQGAAFIELDGARPSPGGKLATIAGAGPLDLVADLVWTHASALSGPDWRAAVRRWSGASGRLELHALRLRAKTVELDARGDDLAVDADGRLVGEVSAHLTQASRTLAAIGRSGAIAPEAAATAGQVIGASASGAAPIALEIHFQAGETTVGPAAVGPSPRIY